MSDPVPEQRRPTPADSLECRQNAEDALRDQAPLSACAWALLAIAAEAVAIRRAGRR
ncbi:hypothetical protein K388_01930 [Streptomyces sp. KhCrAH-43]|uniref:hypothetical protein n=1 Tax=unclassified Streptomyces TaxID=2593676 RepID=UPI0003734CB5|nr:MULTISPECIES: hypothetical protein [unclassified Streptomyces]RAJ64735.1 hypothetical protein K388_01930 [Streptomyces sp. KhCrAH-43]